MTLRLRFHVLCLTTWLIANAAGISGVQAQTAIITDGIQTLTLTPQNVGPYRPQVRADLAKSAGLIVAKTNAFRKEQKLAAIDRDEILDRTAQDFADFMAKNDKYGHRADERTAIERVETQGYEICSVAENIALQFHTTGFSTQRLAEAFVSNWKKSPGHRANMLKPEVTQTGVGIAQSPATGVYYAVQLFGRPRSQAIDFSLANEAPRSVTYRLGGETFTLEPHMVRRHVLCVPSDLELLDDGRPVSTLTPARGELLTVNENDGGMTIGTAQ